VCARKCLRPKLCCTYSTYNTFLGVLCAFISRRGGPHRYTHSRRLLCASSGKKSVSGAAGVANAWAAATLHTTPPAAFTKVGCSPASEQCTNTPLPNQMKVLGGSKSAPVAAPAGSSLEFTPWLPVGRVIKENQTARSRLTGPTCLSWAMQP
jgi:hypothetical protein